MTSTRTVLTADTIPHVALDFMNNTHFEELELLDSLGKLIEQGDKAGITRSLSTWLEHTQAHFARENELMIDIGFPMIAMHSGEHGRVLAELEMIITSWQQDNDIDLLSEYVFIAWPKWFENHVNSMDMITAQFAVMNGFDPHKLEQD